MIGRDAEVARLRDLVTGVADGRGGALVVLGEPGIGKSTLIHAAATHPGDAAVVRVVGVQAEHDVPFAGLHALVGALPEPSTVALPGPQRRALDAALGLAEEGEARRLLVGAALLSLLGLQPPTLLLVDDLHWVDPPSAEAITFAARRLVAEPVAVVLGVRTTEPDAVAAVAGLPALTLGPLPDPAALLPDVDPAVAAALAEATGGNPLAMVEAAAGLTAEQRAGVDPLGVLPRTGAEDAYAARLADLAPDVRAAVRLVALAGRSPLEVQRRALAAVGARAGDVDVLTERGLADPALPARWRHPLARAAAGRGSPQERRDAHRALAEAWHDAATPARAWHLAQAADGADPAAAAALVAVAEDAERRDAALEAAEAWETAATLVDDPTGQTAYTEAAARAALRGGAGRRAAALLDRALLRQPGPEPTARLLWQRGRVQHGLGAPERALEFFLQAQDLAADVDLRVWASAEGLYSAMYAGRPDQARRMAELVGRHHDPARPVHAFLAAHAAGAAASLSHDADEARRHFDVARGLLTDDLLAGEPDLVLWAVNLELFDPVAAGLDAVTSAGIARLRERGDLTWLPRVTHLAASRAEAAGDWAGAEALTDECEVLARMSGQLTQLQEALAALGTLDAVRGEWAALDLRVAELESLQAQTATPWLADQLQWLRALAALTAGDHDHAAAVVDLPGSLDDPEALAELAATKSHPLESALLHLWAGEGLRRVGARVRAREELRVALAAFQRLRATPWITRTEAELRASGATLQRSRPGEDLTPSELRVATRVAEGLSNKEVAAALFLSPKTVEFHLGHAYRKLGVGNRTALAAALRAATDENPPPEESVRP